MSDRTVDQEVNGDGNIVIGEAGGPVTITVGGHSRIRGIDWRRRRSAPELTTEVRDRLLSAARSRSWGQLAQLITLPTGFTELRLEPRVGFVTGDRSTPAAGRNQAESADGIVEAFERSGRRLLLVGAPGSGKTVLAYKIAEHLDRLNQSDPAQPLPIVLSLSTWTPGSTLSSWAIDQLCDPVVGLGLNDRNLAAWLLRSHRLALILDGLDEIGETNRPSCLAALNTHITALPAPPAGPLVVTCRRYEYEALTAGTDTPLGLLAALEPLPLDAAALDANLQALAEGNDLQPGDPRWLAYTRQTLDRPGAPALQALESPFLMALVADTRFDPDQFHTGSDPATVSRQICAAKAADAFGPAAPEVERWITAIAKALKANNQTIFQLEHLTPPSGPRWLKALKGLGVGLAGGASVGLIGQLGGGLGKQLFVALGVGVVVGLFGWLVAGLVVRLLIGPVGRFVVGLFARLVEITAEPSGPGRRRIMKQHLIGGLVCGLLLGLSVAPFANLVFGLVTGLVVGLVLGLIGEMGGGLVDIDARPSRQRFQRPTRQQLMGGLIRGLGVGLVFGVVLGLTGGLINGLVIGLQLNSELGLVFGLFLGFMVGLASGLVFGLVVGIVFGLVVGVVEGFRAHTAIRETVQIDQGLELSRRSLVSTVVEFGLAFGLVSGVISGLFIGWVGALVDGLAGVLVGGLVGGLLIGLDRGGAYVMLQALERRRLRHAGVMPADHVAALEWAIDQGLMRQIGGGVQFRHLLLRDAIADLDPADQLAPITLYMRRPRPVAVPWPSRRSSGRRR